MTRRARDNPFRSSRVEQLEFQLSSTGALERTWPTLLDRFGQLGWRAALVGDKGRGKTTLLEALERRLEADGWTVRRLRLSEEQPTLDAAAVMRLCAHESAPVKVLASIDGVEQLSRWSWWRLCVKGQRLDGLLVTSHRPCGLPVLLHHHTDPQLLQVLLSELVGNEGAELLQIRAASYFEQFSGDLRQTFRALYDDWAGARILWTTGDKMA